jgi:PHD/YefM family antitoxin component YafN of YafNO toxin-antitoxin module
MTINSITEAKANLSALIEKVCVGVAGDSASAAGVIISGTGARP